MKALAWISVVLPVVAGALFLTAGTRPAPAGIAGGGATTADASIAGTTLSQASGADSGRDEHTSIADKAYATYIARYTSFPRQYWISPAGSGKACSQLKPCSFAIGIQKGGPGVVIWLMDGTYNFSQYLVTTASGTSSQHAAYVSQHYGGAKLVSTQGGGNEIWRAQGPHIDFVGLEMTAPGACNTIVPYPNSGGNWTMAYNRVHDVATQANGFCGDGHGGAGLGAWGAETTYIVDNVIWNIGNSTDAAFVHGIYPGIPGVYVANNVVNNVTGGCVHIYHNTYDETVVNNTLSNCQTWGIVYGGAGTCSSTGGIGSGYIIKNNIIANSADSRGAISTYCDRGSPAGVVDHNLEFNNSNRDNNHSGGPIPTNTIFRDPQFVNYASPGSGGDFRLKSGSAAVRAGTKTHAPPDDFDGIARGDSPSIGAYEQ
jgi:hypothetical protein